MNKTSNKAKGGNARAAKLSPEERSKIASIAAKVRWDNKGKLVDENEFNDNPALTKAIETVLRSGKNTIKNLTDRDIIAVAVLQGLYSDIVTARQLVVSTLGEAMPLMEGFTRIAYSQADEVIRLRSV